MKAILIIEVDDKTNFDEARADITMQPDEYGLLKGNPGKKWFNNITLKPLPEWKEELPTKDTIIEHRLPENRYASSILLEKAINKAKQRGYNECLEDILGEDNEKCK